jgi:hypothetical protein
LAALQFESEIRIQKTEVRAAGAKF